MPAGAQDRSPAVTTPAARAEEKTVAADLPQDVADAPSALTEEPDPAPAAELPRAPELSSTVPAVVPSASLAVPLPEAEVDEPSPADAPAECLHADSAAPDATALPVPTGEPHLPSSRELVSAVSPVHDEPDAEEPVETASPPDALPAVAAIIGGPGPDTDHMGIEPESPVAVSVGQEEPSHLDVGSTRPVDVESGNGPPADQGMVRDPPHSEAALPPPEDLSPEESAGATPDEHAPTLPFSHEAPLPEESASAEGHLGSTAETDAPQDRAPEGQSDPHLLAENAHDRLEPVVAIPPAENASSSVVAPIPAGSPCKIHVEVFIASRVLAAQVESFSRSDLQQQIIALFGDERPGVSTFVRSSRTVANREFGSRYVFNYLWLLPNGNLRVFCPGVDIPARGRLHAPFQPPADDVPSEFQHLLETVNLDDAQDSLPGQKLLRDAHDSRFPERPKTLGGWERRLAGLWPSIRMILELDLSAEDSQHLAALIRGQVVARGPTRALSHLCHHSPRALVTSLTLLGVYGYRGGYWGPACRAIGIDYSWASTSDWGYAYVQQCRELGLTADVSQGDAYVGVILFQGGLPISCLPGFFESCLLPAVIRPDWSGMGARELIAEWLSGPTRRSMTKPVERFLQYGGEVAADLVAGLRLEATRQQQGAAPDQAEESGLPEYLQTACREWFASGRSDASTANAAGLQPVPAERYASPVLAFAPWGDGVHIVLPEQRVVSERGSSALSWQVSADGVQNTVSVRSLRSGPSSVTTPVTVCLQRPAKSLRVALQAGNLELRSWEYPDVDASRSLLVFDPATGRFVADFERFPGDVWWVLCPPGTRLVPEPADTPFITELFPPLSRDWDGWSACEVDVSSLTSLAAKGGRRERTFATTRTENRAQPHLVGGRLVPDGHDATPLYVGAPPQLYIPVPIGTPRQSILEQWFLEVRRADGTPGRARVVPSRHLSGDVRWAESAILVALDDDKVLGPRPFGTFAVSCTTTGGRSTFRFRVVPQFDVHGPTQLLVPPPDADPPPVTVAVDTDADTTVTLRHAQPHLLPLKHLRAAGRSRYAIQVPPCESDLHLRLTRVIPQGEVDIDVPVLIPWLRWRLTGIGRHGHAPWAGGCLNCSVDALEQSSRPALVVDLPGVHSAAPVTLCVLDPSGDCLQEIPAQRQARPSRYHVFDLRTARDTLREAVPADTAVQMHLHVRRQDDDLDLALLRVTRHAVLETLTMSQESAALTASWSPEIPLRHRELRLWSQTRPWEEPVLLTIPDDAQGEARWDWPGQALDSGLYVAELVAADPWSSDGQVRRPAAAAPHAHLLWHGDAPKRLSALGDRVAEDLATYEEVAECVFMHLAYGAQEAIPPLVDWCFRHVDLAPLDVLLATVDGLSAAADCRALALRLYTPERVRAVTEACALGEWDSDKLARYLRQCPPLGILRIDSLVALLAIDDADVRSGAARTLIEKAWPDGLVAVLAWLAEGAITIEDALDLLDVNPSFTMEHLAARCGTEMVDRLLDALALAHPDQIRIVRKGYWVRCRFGWGLITEIRDGQGRPSPQAHIDDLKDGHVLRLVVRPEDDRLAVTLKLAAQSVAVDGRPRDLYECSKCERFITGSADLVRGKHNHEAHDGLGPSMNVHMRTAALCQRSGLSFSAATPENVWC